MTRSYALKAEGAAHEEGHADGPQPGAGGERQRSWAVSASVASLHKTYPASRYTDCPTSQILFTAGSNALWLVPPLA